MNSLAGYPHFMQSLSNPMQSGLNWSAFGNSISNLTQVNQNPANPFKNIRKRSAESMDTKTSAKNMKAGYYSTIGSQGYNQVPKSESQNQLLKIQEQLGNMTQQLGATLSTGAVDMRQVLQANISNPLGAASTAPDARQILQEIYPGLNALEYCRDYCAKKQLLMEYVSTQPQGMSYAPFTFILNVLISKRGPVLQAYGTDMSVMAAKQRAAEQMIPKLLQLLGPMRINSSHFQKSGFESNTTRRRFESNNSRRRSKSKNPPKTSSDQEWLEYIEKLSPSAKNSTSVLYAWAQRKGLDVPKYEIVNGPRVNYEAIDEEPFEDVTPEEKDGIPDAKKPKIEDDPTKRYSVCCTFQGKEYIGEDMDRKKAKQLASAAAWKEFCPK